MRTLKLIRPVTNQSSIAIPDERLIHVAVGSEGRFTSARMLGNFTEKSLYLSSEYEWMFGRDNNDSLIVVPLLRGGW